MESKIIERDRMLLVGFSFFGDPFAESGDRIPHVAEEGLEE